MPEKIEQLTRAHAAQIAELDYAGRPGDFLPSLGLDFLTLLYQQLLGGRETWAHGAVDKTGHLLGFVVGCSDIHAAFRRLSPLRNPRMFIGAATALLRRPSRILKMAESAFYPAHKTSHFPAELVVMGVKQGVRSKGLGSNLLLAAAREAQRRGAPAWRVTVKTKNDRAIRFYIKNGFRLTSSFHMYGEGWEEMVADLGPQVQALELRAGPSRP